MCLTVLIGHLYKSSLGGFWLTFLRFELEICTHLVFVGCSWLTLYFVATWDYNHLSFVKDLPLKALALAPVEQIVKFV